MTTTHRNLRLSGLEPFHIDDQSLFVNGQGDHHTPPVYVEHTFRKYLECGIFAHGFARARCDACGHDFFVAFSCKGRGVCPSCNTRRMVETAAHLSDHVFPRLPVRQWVLSVPKRLRYFMQRDGVVLNSVLHIFLRVIAQSLQAHCSGAAQVDKRALHIGAVAFIHRFGSSLNEHVHFHVCVVDGVFEVAADEALKYMLEGQDISIKPETININGHEVPAPVREPLELGKMYLFVHFWDDAVVSEVTWSDDRVDRHRLKWGLIHSTKEAAIAHAEALLSFTRSDK